MTIIEMIASIVIMLLVNIILIKYGLKIYRVGVLNYSAFGIWKRIFFFVEIMPIIGSDIILPIYHKIDTSRVKELVSKGGILIDLRPKEQYLHDHVLDAKWYLKETALFNIIKDFPNKNTILILYCASGINSKILAQKLVLKGYTGVYDLGKIENGKKLY